MSATITIRHNHADGTLVEGSRKGDGVWEILRGLHHNWRYFPSIGAIGIGQSRDRVAKRWVIEAAATVIRSSDTAPEESRITVPVRSVVYWMTEQIELEG